MNRHYYSEAPAIWGSHKFQLKEKLASIDHIGRIMFSELQYIGMKKDDIFAFLGENFAALVEEVAAEQEAITNGRKPR